VHHSYCIDIHNAIAVNPEELPRIKSTLYLVKRVINSIVFTLKIAQEDISFCNVEMADFCNRIDLNFSPIFIRNLDLY